MAKVTISEVEVLNSECRFEDPFRFKIRFNCIEDLPEDLDWKVLYVGSANSCQFDQGKCPKYDIIRDSDITNIL